MVDEIGEEFIFQFVTDNEAMIKVSGKMLMQRECTCIGQHVLLIAWILFWKKLRYTQGRELLLPGITRFVTNFITLESIVRSKQTLK
ncbi:hypothetical protein Golax_025675 [Gossypium laxum]|uniref:DUF659 domain-containing protein n=1 Tax=Gossypium laxum TaxID=34288 RepID=A0A7J9B1V8_9ROSI|nr:hypothetical protein [Gossypium laxum]